MHLILKKYTAEDLSSAEKMLIETESILDSFDLENADTDMIAALAAKKNWEDAHRKYKEILNILHPSKMNQ